MVHANYVHSVIGYAGSSNVFCNPNFTKEHGSVVSKNWTFNLNAYQGPNSHGTSIYPVKYIDPVQKRHLEEPKEWIIEKSSWSIKVGPYNSSPPPIHATPVFPDLKFERLKVDR